jgi:hypothetical protein
MKQKYYSCPICRLKKRTSPIIHGLSIMKKYSKHGLKLHIANHKKNNDEDLVEKWMNENGDIESCLLDK